jgi:DNA-binding MarR family transcriptional regulator
MFFLKDLPTEQTLKEIAKRYADLDPSALTTCAALLRTGSDLLTAFETILGRHGLSQGRFLTLIMLNRTPDTAINPSILAEKVGVKRATMTGLLDGLEKNGFVIRLAHSQDRRRVSIQLTDSGKKVLSTMLPDYYSRIAKLMEEVTEEERGQLISLLKKIDQGLMVFSK